MKTTEYKSINFIIGYVLGKIQQFCISMNAGSHPFDGSVVVIPKSWFGLFEDLPAAYREISSNVVSSPLPSIKPALIAANRISNFLGKVVCDNSILSLAICLMKGKNNNAKINITNKNITFIITMQKSMNNQIIII